MRSRLSQSIISPTSSHCSTVALSSSTISHDEDSLPEPCPSNSFSISSLTNSFRCMPFLLLIPIILLLPSFLSLSHNFHSIISFRSIKLISSPPFSISSPVSYPFSKPSTARIAYYIQLTPKSLPLLPRLYSRLWHSSNIYLLHFDPAIPESTANRTLKELQNQFPSTSTTPFQSHTFVLPRHSISYNGVSMVLSTLTAMRYLLTNTNVPSFDFFINLSGSDYPLVPPDLPGKLLAQVMAYDPIFLSTAEPQLTKTRFRQRFTKLQVDLAAISNKPNLIEIKGDQSINPLLSKTSRAMNDDLQLPFEPVHSASWLIASRRFCEYAVTSSFANRLLVGMANMKGSDEFFFGTLAKKSNYWWKRLVPHVMRLVVWELNGMKSGQHPFWLDHSRRGEKDKWTFESTINKGPHWMGRKFRIKDSEIMNKIDHMVENKDRLREVYSNWEWITGQLKARYTNGGTDEEYIER